jgi:xanthine dehydrogenase accessory factor
MNIRLEEAILRCLKQNEDAVLATIISHSGSTPRTSGSKMLVRGDGSISGTIGGGLMEASVIRSAADIFASRRPQIVPFNLGDSTTADSMDMICGGDVRVLLEFVESTKANRLLLRKQIELRKNGEKFLLIAMITGADESIERIDRFLLTDAGMVHGDPPVNRQVLNEIKAQTRGERSPVLIALDTRRFLVEPAFVRGTVFLFGAGHVSQQVAILAKMVDFRVTVLDDRNRFANRERFANADEIIVLPDFNKSFSNLDMDADSYIVIVTRGHVHDKTVLEQALRTGAGYVGMIGSRRKRDAIYAALQKKGFTEEDIKRVHSPIGLSIGAETPQEIAVSIVGELIAHRSGI